MKKFMFIFIMLLLIPLGVSASTIESFTDDDFFKKAHVGWNLGNQLDSTITWDGTANLKTETRWGNPMITQALIDEIQKSGFNVIRIPVSWYCHTYKDDNGNYIIHEEWMNRVQEVVDYAYSRGMYVILNTHHDDKVLYTGVNDAAEFDAVKSVAHSFWNQIATRFKDYDEHLLFEAYNEIDNKLDSWVLGEVAEGQVNELNQIFVDTVRETGSNNRYRLLVISPLIMKNSKEAINAVTVPTDSVEHKIILSVHMYPNIEDEQLDAAFAQISDSAAEKGLRVMITEFGNTTDYQPSNHRALANSNFVARAYEHGIITCYWDNGAEFSIINRNNPTSKNTELIDAMVNPAKYYNKNGHTVINTMDKFYFKRLDKYGAFDEKNLPNWWGTWVNEELIEIPANQDYLTMSAPNRTLKSLLNLHGVYFFDENQQFLSSSVQNFPGYEYAKFKIPEGAKYFRYVLYNCKENTRLPFFTDAVENGQIYVVYGTYALDDIVMGDKVTWYHEDTPEEPSEPGKKDSGSNESTNKEEKKESKADKNPNTGVELIPVAIIVITIFNIAAYYIIRKYHKAAFIKIK